MEGSRVQKSKDIDCTDQVRLALLTAPSPKATENFSQIERDLTLARANRQRTMAQKCCTPNVADAAFAIHANTSIRTSRQNYQADQRYGTRFRSRSAFSIDGVSFNSEYAGA